MAFFRYKLVPDRVQDRYEIFAKPDGTGPECTQQFADGVLVAYALGINHPNPAIHFIKPMPVSGVEAICAAVRERQSAL